MNRRGARKGLRSKLCSRCDIIKELPSKRYCRKCNAAYTREWRKRNPLTAEQRFKANTRSKTKVYVKRGLIIKQPCEICGDVNAQAHHEDYNDAYKVKWFCMKCHREHHLEESYNAFKWKQLKIHV